MGDVTVICPQGFINAHTVRQIEQALSQALEDGHEKILINGSGLAYIASAGLGVIMGLIEDTRAKGGDIRHAGAQRHGAQHFRGARIQPPLHGI